MLFKRYASPYVFLDSLIENHALKEGLQNLFYQSEEEKLYQLYLSFAANPFAEITVSFDEWKEQLQNSSENSGLSEQQVNTAVDKANNILENFVPQKAGGA